MYNLDPFNFRKVRLAQVSIQSSRLPEKAMQPGRNSELVTVVRGRKPIHRLAKSSPLKMSGRCPKLARQRLFTPPRQADDHIERFRLWERSERLKNAICAIRVEPEEDIPSMEAPEPEIDIERIFIKDILYHVCAVYGIGKVDLLSNRRYRGIVRPRQVCMYLARKHTTRSLPEIGRHLGRKDHTTVMHGDRKIRSLLEAGDKDLAKHIAMVEERIL